MTNVTHVKGYTRRKPNPEVTYMDTTEALYPLGLQHLLAIDLEERLSGVLDDPQFGDLSEADRNRLKETY